MLWHNPFHLHYRLKPSHPSKMNDNSDLRLGDCLELMRDIPDASVDLILCDLPYGTTRNKWDSIIPLATLWGEYRRISRGAIVLTAQAPFDKVLGVSNLAMQRASDAGGYSRRHHQGLRG